MIEVHDPMEHPESGEPPAPWRPSPSVLVATVAVVALVAAGCQSVLRLMRENDDDAGTAS